MMDATNQEDRVVVNLPHHIQQDLCTTRATYRQGKKLTAIKVYTVNNESQHLLIYRVPEIKLQNELQALCENYGKLITLHKLELVDPGEVFTEIFHVCYSSMRDARKAKRFLDGRSFYGSLLHVCYAPELESVEETRLKLINRRNEIAYFTGRKPKVHKINSNIISKRKLPVSRDLHRNKMLRCATQGIESLNKPQTCDNGPGNILPSTSISLAEASEDVSIQGSSGKTSISNPYDRTPSYPSQEMLQLPGEEVKSARDIKFTPTSVLKRNTATNKIIFHKKPFS